MLGGQQRIVDAQQFALLERLEPPATRVVVGIGEDSAGEECDRTSRALTAQLGIEPTMFPGGHIGFVDDPDRFATRLRAVLHDDREAS